MGDMRCFLKIFGGKRVSYGFSRVLKWFSSSFGEKHKKRNKTSGHFLGGQKQQCLAVLLSVTKARQQLKQVDRCLQNMVQNLVTPNNHPTKKP